MNFRRLIFVSALVAAVAACKDDDETAALPGLDGTLVFTEVPEFISPGETLTMKPSGLTHPDGGEIGYYWKVSPVMDSYDTTRFLNGLDKYGNPSDGSFSLKFPSDLDSLDTYTIYCYAYATGYSGSSATTYTTIVKGGKDGSIKGTATPAAGSMTVDGIIYYTASIGEQTWTLNNLSAGDAGIPFRNAPAMSDVFGNFYNQQESTEACALLGEGWRLPSDEDWDTLVNNVSGNGGTVAAAMMADATFNGYTMWEYWPAVGEITNSSRFSAIPAGYTNIGASFDGVYRYAAFWTSSKTEDGTMGIYRYLVNGEPEMFKGEGDPQSFGASVRCVKTAE